MIAEVKELLSLIEKVPQMALNVLAGFAIYKLIIYLSSTGAIITTIRFIINKAYDYAIRPRPPVEHVWVWNFLKFESEQTAARAVDVLSSIAKNSNDGLFGGSRRIIGREHVDFIELAIKQKLDRDAGALNVNRHQTP